MLCAGIRLSILAENAPMTTAWANSVLSMYCSLFSTVVPIRRGASLL